MKKEHIWTITHADTHTVTVFSSKLAAIDELCLWFKEDQRITDLGKLKPYDNKLEMIKVKTSNGQRITLWLERRNLNNGALLSCID